MKNKVFGFHQCSTCFSSVVVLTSLLLSPLAVAQNSQQEGGASNVDEEVIVTGTPGGGALNKLDASFSVTTASAEDIGKFSPKSTADLLKLVPGVWAESSGGVSGANVFVRGFPGGGDAPFLTTQIDGMTFFPPPTLSFLENTTLFRIDETVKSMQALRGGPNPVLSNGQPGLTTNFLLKEGGPETEGLIKFTTSDYDLRRIDAVLSGELTEDLYYLVGGYLSSSPGIRDAGFNAEEGEQFTINITKQLDNGKIKFFNRSTDDHGVWYLPSALNVPGVDNGYTQIGPSNRQAQITTPRGSRTVDLGEGRGWDGSVTGLTFEIDMANDWRLVNRTTRTTGNADTLALVSSGSAVRVGSLSVGNNIIAGDANTLVTGPITGAVSGDQIGQGDFIQQFGAWEVRKDIEAFVNDLTFTKAWDTVDLSLGYYTASTSVKDDWALGNRKYYVVRSGGEQVTGIACNDPGDSDDSCGGDYDLDATGDATTNALYGLTTFDINDRLTLDAGLRVENHKVKYSADEDADGIADLVIDTSETAASYTAGINYALNENSGIFFRLNNGKKMPYFDDYRDNRAQFLSGNDLLTEVIQYELGYKLSEESVDLYVTGFYTEVDPATFVALTGLTQAQSFINKSTGIEIDGNYYAGDFRLNVNATIQDAKIEGGPNDGNEAQRQPGWQVRLAPSYQFSVAETPVTVYGAVTAIDDRFSDNENSVVLEGYEKVDLGVIVDFNDGLQFQLSADNLTDNDGLTEGDPRNPDSPNGRYILPRSFKLSLAYHF